MMSTRHTVAIVAEVVLAIGVLTATVNFLAPSPQTGGDDLVQDYLSAWALMAGEDPYQPLPPLRRGRGCRRARNSK